MEFEWHEEKRQRNIKERGLDFLDIIPLFFDPTSYVIDDKRKDYGEHRQVLFGYIGSSLYQVCFTKREKNIRIISARRANKRERIHYEQFQKNHGGSNGGRAGSA
jgi:uncharacterized DUF497 family protein